MLRNINIAQYILQRILLKFSNLLAMESKLRKYDIANRPYRLRYISRRRLKKLANYEVRDMRWRVLPQCFRTIVKD